MSPTSRTAGLLALAAVVAVAVSPAVGLLLVLALAVATVLDARAVRSPPRVSVDVASVLSRGVPVPLRAEAHAQGAAAVALRQAVPPDLVLVPREADGALEATLTGLRRGRHELPALGTRAQGPLGLATWTHRSGTPTEVQVFPDLGTARRLALAVRQGRFRDPGVSARGPLGLGTAFESVRDYEPDDDIRQVNWRATARTGRPMSNQFRVEQDRDVLCLVDTGRLMGAPVTTRAGRPPLTGLDAALDAVAAVGLVADEVGDRCGALAFDHEVRAEVRPRRAGGRLVVQALYDLEPRATDSDYERAFWRAGAAKRAFVLVLTDLVEEAAARQLVAAVPMLARRHVVVVASVADAALTELPGTPPADRAGAYRTAVALEVLQARERAVAEVRRGGAEVVEAPAEDLPAACVRAYLRAKARARL